MWLGTGCIGLTDGPRQTAAWHSHDEEQSSDLLRLYPPPPVPVTCFGCDELIEETAAISNLNRWPGSNLVQSKMPTRAPSTASRPSLPPSLTRSDTSRSSSLITL